MKFKANFMEKPGNFQMDDCEIEKVVELSHEDFCRLKITPLENQPFRLAAKRLAERQEAEKQQPVMEEEPAVQSDEQEQDAPALSMQM